MTDAAHRFVTDLDGAIHRNQLSDEQAIYLLAQVARDLCIDRSLDWSALTNHFAWNKPWRGHHGYTTLANEPGTGQFLKVWSLNRAKESK